MYVCILQSSHLFCRVSDCVLVKNKGKKLDILFWMKDPNLHTSKVLNNANQKARGLRGVFKTDFRAYRKVGAYE
jgi:hypothetical protein